MYDLALTGIYMWSSPQVGITHMIAGPPGIGFPVPLPTLLTFWCANVSKKKFWMSMQGPFVLPLPKVLTLFLKWRVFPKSAFPKADLPQILLNAWLLVFSFISDPCARILGGLSSTHWSSQLRELIVSLKRWSKNKVNSSGLKKECMQYFKMNLDRFVIWRIVFCPLKSLGR